MKNFGKAVVKTRFLILIVAVVLLFPSAIAYLNTRVNYDMLTYLPKDLESMKGQDILVDEFGTGAISMVVIEDKSAKEIKPVASEIKKVPHVKDVLWYGEYMDESIPLDILPDKLHDAIKKGDATLMAITYDTTMSADETMEAVKKIRTVIDRNYYLSGMTAVLQDTKEMAEKEEPIYVGLAVALAATVLAFTMDTFLAPVMFLLSIGMAIVYNLGTNIFLGQISYITKCLAAILQLGVTMDYSIFLWNSYEEQKRRYPGENNKAMAEAINLTLQSVVGSSVTTIAGFAALCFMSFTFGRDVGIVMMKGVIMGVIGCVTILPSLILISDPLIEKTRHRRLLPKFSFLPGFVRKHYKGILIAFCVIWIPAAFGDLNVKSYYNILGTLPKDLPSSQGTTKMEETFNTNNELMILVSSDLSTAKTSQMCDKLEKVSGVQNVLGMDAMLGGGIPREMVPDKLKDVVQSDHYKLILVNSEYKTATDEVNAQIDSINKIIKGYDSKAMLIGEAPGTKDLIRISNNDFNVVNWVSIAMIFLIVAFVFKSGSLPFLLVLVIEQAIFINMSVAYYMGTELAFIASIVIGTVQLGSTVDYAILMTSRYQLERSSGRTREDAIEIAHRTSIPSIIVSALTFFGSTFGVAIYSDIEIIGELCTLMARGALISMFVVLTVLPAILMAFDPIIVRTSKGFLPPKGAAVEKKDEQSQAEAADAHAQS